MVVRRLTPLFHAHQTHTPCHICLVPGTFPACSLHALSNAVSHTKHIFFPAEISVHMSTHLWATQKTNKNFVLCQFFQKNHFPRSLLFGRKKNNSAPRRTPSMHRAPLHSSRCCASIDTTFMVVQCLEPHVLCVQTPTTRLTQHAVARKKTTRVVNFCQQCVWCRWIALLVVHPMVCGEWNIYEGVLMFCACQHTYVARPNLRHNLLGEKSQLVW